MSTVMFWRGKSVDQMTETELKRVIAEMGAQITSLQEYRKTEVERTARWMKSAFESTK